MVQLGWIAFDNHYIVAAALHETLGDGTLRQQGIDGDDPALFDQSRQQVLEDRESYSPAAWCHRVSPRR